jgi:DNA polymerase III alpha subunit
LPITLRHLDCGGIVQFATADCEKLTFCDILMGCWGKVRTYEMLSRGDSIGVFQLESSGINTDFVSIVGLWSKCFI